MHSRRNKKWYREKETLDVGLDECVGRWAKVAHTTQLHRASNMLILKRGRKGLFLDATYLLLFKSLLVYHHINIVIMNLSWYKTGRDYKYWLLCADYCMQSKRQQRHTSTYAKSKWVFFFKGKKELIWRCLVRFKLWAFACGISKV